MSVFLTVTFLVAFFPLAGPWLLSEVRRCSACTALLLTCHFACVCVSVLLSLNPADSDNRLYLQGDLVVSDIGPVVFLCASRARKTRARASVFPLLLRIAHVCNPALPFATSFLLYARFIPPNMQMGDVSSNIKLFLHKASENVLLSKCTLQ